MAFYQWRVGSYARSIYLDGTKTFAMAMLESELYTQAIKVYASEKFAYSQIDDTFTKGYINLVEYNDTIALKLLIEPRLLAKIEEVIV